MSLMTAEALNGPNGQMSQADLALKQCMDSLEPEEVIQQHESQQQQLAELEMRSDDDPGFASDDDTMTDVGIGSRTPRTPIAVSGAQPNISKPATASPTEEAEEEWKTTVLTNLNLDGKDCSSWAKMADYLFIGFQMNRRAFIDRLIKYRKQGGRDDSLTFDPSNELTLLNTFNDIYIHTHPLLLASLLWGNLAEDKLNEPKIKKELEAMDQLASSKNKFPGIYHQQLVDPKGRSPTPTQLIAIADMADAYVTTGPQGLTVPQLDKINNWIKTVKKTGSTTTSKPIPSGVRSYVSTDKSSMSSERVKNVKAFTKALRERISKMDQSLTQVPLAVPLCEVGWTLNLHTRLNDHKNHRSSNYIMNLFEAICGVLFPTQQYRMAQEIIYLCYRPEQPMLAEIFFTRACQGYIDNGSGFSHCQAGTNNLVPDGYEWYKLEYELHRKRTCFESRHMLAKSIEDEHLALTESIGIARHLKLDSVDPLEQSEVAMVQAIDKLQRAIDTREQQIATMHEFGHTAKKVADALEGLHDLAEQYDAIVGREAAGRVRTAAQRAADEFRANAGGQEPT